MKRNILMFLIVTFLISGCSKNENSNLDYSNFEHANLRENEIIRYTFYNDKKEHTYAVADITTEDYETAMNALYYQVGDNDYILLDKIETCDSGAYVVTKAYTSFFQNSNQNKLYLNRCMGAVQIEYTLDKEKIEKKELKFDFSKIMEETPEYYVRIKTIDSVDEAFIYYNANIHNQNDSEMLIKCSLSNYVCEKIN